MQAAGDGTFELDCLYAGRDGEDRNRNSSVMLLKKGSFSMLFTGDTTAEDERLFSSDPSVRKRIPEKGISVLKVAHHGSSSSTTDEFLDCFRPAAAVISCGRNNRYGHPSPEVTERLTERGIRILQTQELGAVRIRPDFGKTDRK
jgi:competence protein ComEC